MSKDMVAFELIDACSHNQCPICELVKKRTLQSMKSFLYQSVNDIGIRNQLIKSRGLCNYHSRLLMEMGDPFAHSILYGDLVEHAIRDARRGDYQPYSSHPDCRYCEAAHVAEASYITTFLENYPDKKFRDPYVENGMLCMTHLGMLKQEAEKKRLNSTYEKVLEDTLQKYQVVIACLSETRRKTDYRYTSESLTEAERDAWKKAVGIINSQT